MIARIIIGVYEIVFSPFLAEKKVYSLFLLLNRNKDFHINVKAFVFYSLKNNNFIVSDTKQEKAIKYFLQDNM